MCVTDVKFRSTIYIRLPFRRSLSLSLRFSLVSLLIQVIIWGADILYVASDLADA